MDKTERQELHCHNCNNYVQFDVDLSVDGNMVLNCPVCGHEHCRVVKDGVITDERWDRRNPNIYTTYATNIGWTTASTYNNYTSAYSSNSSSWTSTVTYNYNSSGYNNPYLYQSWLNTTAIG